MTDYAAAATYLLATALLLQTKHLADRSKVFLYAMSVGISILIKSSLVLYYVPHFLLHLKWLCLGRSHRRKSWSNFVFLAGIILLRAGWFYFPNLQQILTYYAAWAASRSTITKTAARISKANVVDFSMVPFYFLISVAYLYDRKEKPSTNGLIETFSVGILLSTVGLTLSQSANRLVEAAP